MYGKVRSTRKKQKSRSFNRVTVLPEHLIITSQQTITGDTASKVILIKIQTVLFGGMTD